MGSDLQICTLGVQKCTSQQAAETVLQFEILASYMEEDIFKPVGGNILKGIYQKLDAVSIVIGHL